MLPDCCPLLHWSPLSCRPREGTAVVFSLQDLSWRRAFPWRLLQYKHMACFLGNPMMSLKVFSLQVIPLCSLTDCNIFFLTPLFFEFLEMCLDENFFLFLLLGICCIPLSMNSYLSSVLENSLQILFLIHSLSSLLLGFWLDFYWGIIDI